MEGSVVKFALDAFGLGSVVSITAILLGYAIGKALSLVDNT